MTYEQAVLYRQKAIDDHMNNSHGYFTCIDFRIAQARPGNYVVYGTMREDCKENPPGRLVYVWSALPTLGSEGTMYYTTKENHQALSSFACAGLIYLLPPDFDLDEIEQAQEIINAARP